MFEYNWAFSSGAAGAHGEFSLHGLFFVKRKPPAVPGVQEALSYGQVFCFLSK